MRFLAKLEWLLLVLLCAFAALGQTQAPPGSSIQNTAYVSYVDTSGKAVENIPSNIVFVTVTSLTAGQLLQSQNVTYAPGGQVIVQHHLNNVGNTTDTYYVAVNGQPGSDFPLTGLVIYLDANNNGKIDPGEAQLTPTTPVQLTAGQSASLLVVGTVPLTAVAGQKAVLQISATDEVNTPLTNTDIVTVGTGGTVSGPVNVVLQKTSNVSSATSGQNVQFTLQLWNLGMGNASTSPITLDGVVQSLIYVLDMVPANTHFASITNANGATVFYHALGTTSGQFTSAAPTNANIDYVGFAVPQLDGGQSYSFGFNVRVDDNASGNINNMATVTFAVQSQSQVVNSNTVTVALPLVPPTIGYYTDTTFSQSAKVSTIGGMVHIQAVASACNADPTVAEKHLITVTTNQTHDMEQFMAVESGPNTGVFQVQSVVLADAHTVPVVQGDGILEVYKDEVLTATITGCGTNASALATIVVDPYGVLFDSHTDKIVSGAQVTLIDVTGQANGGHPGQPATVLQADGKTSAPSTVTSAGDGSYQFPVVGVSTYKLTIVPPNGYKFPSSLSPATLPQDRKVNQPGSYGGNFPLTSVAGVINFDVPLDAGPLSGLFIQKTPDEANVESGSLVGYVLEIKNNTGQDMPNTTVVDTLPSGFLYQLHSATLGGKPLADPAGGKGPVLTFSIGDLPVNGDVMVHYYVRLLPQANSNNSINTAYAASGITRSNIAQASIKIFGGVFDTKGVIVGKVYADCNGNHVQDPDEPGIPGVRIYLDNGTFAITDDAGKYSIFGVTAQLHGLKMDGYTLPAGFEPEVLSSRNAGDGRSQFVDMISGELHRSDFALTGCSAAAMKSLEARLTAKKGSPSETAALLKKTPLLDRTNQSLEERRAVPTSALLEGGNLKDTAANTTVSGSSSTTASTTTNSPTAASQTLPVAAPAVAASGQTGIAAPSSPNASSIEANSSEATKRQEPDTQGGLRVVKLIRPSMTNEFDFIGLHDGQVVGSTQIDVILKGMLGTDFALSVNGKKMSGDRVGQKSTEASISLQAWLFIGMELHPGKNTLEARMFDTFGNERGSRSITVIAPGALAAIIVEPATRNPVADGKTPLRVSVRLVDAHGVPVTSRTPVTLETSTGKWDVDDLNPKEPGTQVFIEGGQAEYNLIPPMTPADGKIAVTSGTFSNESKLSFIPELRPLMAIGVVDQTLSFRRFSGSNAQTATFYTLENDLSRLSASTSDGSVDYASHIGTLLKGRVWGNTLMTLSYDSDKRSGDPMFRDSQSDDYYLVYGDSSTRGYDAQSTSRLYLRLDRGKDYLMFGDYNTGDSQNPAKVLSNINRSFTGLRVHQENSWFQYTAYTTRDNVQQTVEEIPANGSSGPYLVSRIDLVLNSQTVEILVRDRNQPALILKDTTETVMSDYEFDGLTGAIIFKQPIPSYDPSMNPVSIRVTYEFSSGGPKYWMSGVDSAVRINKLHLGGTLYDDKTPQAGLRLWGANGTYDFSKDARLVAEFARTWTPLLGYGNGTHIEFKQKNSKIDSRVYFGRTDATFNNPNAMLNQGRGESGANITWKVDQHLRLHFELIRSEATDTGVSQTGAYATVQRDISKTVSVEFGYRHAGAMSNTTTTATTVGTTTGTAEGSSTSTPANDDLYVKVNAKIPNFKKASVYSEYEDDMADFSKRMLSLGGTYQFSEKGKFYVRHELVSSLGNLYQLNGAQQQNATVFGIDTTYMKNEHIFTEYRGTDAFPGYETEAAIGLRNVFSLRPGLRLSTTAESVKTLSGATTNNALALTGSLEYTAAARWKSSGRFEWRQSTSSDAILSSYGLAIKLSDNYTLLNRSIYSLTIPKTSGETDRLQIRVQNGIAFRPNHSNRLTVLAMAELKEEKDGTSTIVIPDRKVAILTLAANYQPTSKIVVSARYATKWSNDITNVVDDTLDGHMLTTRVMRDVGRSWNVGLDSSALLSDHFGNIQYAYGFEVGHILRKNMWLSAGYNVTGFYDRDLTGDEATRRGPFVRMRFKFDESMFPFLKSEGRQ